MYFNDASVTKVVPVGVRMGTVLWEKTSNATNTGLTIWEPAFGLLGSKEKMKRIPACVTTRMSVPLTKLEIVFTLRISVKDKNRQIWPGRNR